MSMSRPFALLPAFALASATALAAQQPVTKDVAPPSHAAAFVVRLGTDTLAVERSRRTGDAYSVEQVLRVPRTALRHTHLALTPSGQVADVFYMHHAIGAPMDAPLEASTRLRFAGADSARVEQTRGDSTRVRTVAARPDMIPSLPQAWLPYELAAMRLRASGADSLAVGFLDVGGSVMPVTVQRLGADSMLFVLPFLTYRAHVDAAGHIQHLYVPNGTSVRRVPAVDVNAIATAWHAQDRAGRAMGPLSPLDSVRATIGGADVAVIYSRPAARGREVWGTLVPYGEVWRTGANAATVLRTSRDLVIGGAAVPAGTYTLFTLPTRDGATLIINRETMRDGEPLAGTAYDPTHDLVRVPMAVSQLATPEPRLTIAVEPAGAGANRGTLAIIWDRRRMTVPVEVR